MQKNISLRIATAILLATNSYAQTSEDLGMITVTSATKSEQSIKDVTSNVEIITESELSDGHFSNVIDALRNVSGIDIISNGGLGQTSFVRINGMHYSTTLVLIDGVRYNDITNGSAFLENILVDDIKQIEVIKGAQSGIWGADASGGVINIITKKPKDGLTGMLNTEYGSFNTKKIGGRVSYKKDNYYLQFNKQKTTTDGFTSQASQGEDISKYEDDGYENTSTSIQTGFHLNDSNKIDISHKIIDSEVEYDVASYPPPTYAETIQPNDKIAKSESKSKFTKINFNHIDSFNEVDLYLNKSSFDRDAGGTLYIGDVKEMGLKSNIKYNQNDFVVLGVDRKEFTQEKGYEFEYSNNGIFLTNSNSLNNLVVTESLRKDTYSKFQDKTTGKLGLKYLYNDIEVASNYGTGYKAPSLYELSHDGGNNLKPEYTKSLDASIKYKDLEVKYFKNNIDDLLGYNNNNTYDYSDDFYENIDGTSVIKGYEISYQKEILNATVLTLDYTNLDAKDKDNKTLGRVPEDLLKGSVDYYGINKLHININGKYVGDRLDMNGEPTGGNKTGKYTVMNAVVNYDLNKKIKVYTKIDNLTDKDYQEVYGYTTSPRAYYVGINATF